MESIDIAGNVLNLDDYSIEFRQIVGLIVTSAGTVIILHDGSSVLANLSPEDLFTVSDGCPWACCSV
ncbi:MAG: hypothetical protein A3205_05775 [Methanomassiliicoccales archaeon Mx-03]|nr:MAG: hypothetical protein A3205_05775 [Methanomassiliicoccales archaeon Mx-03]